MRFLVDAQLPPALARWLASKGHTTEHVMDCGLEAADDKAVWHRAEMSRAVIVTKDEDFAVRRTLHGGEHPAVVWIRLGNTSRRELLRWFEPLLPTVLDALAQGEMLIEIS